MSTDPADLARGLAALAPRLTPGAATIANLKRLSGGASQETWSFDVPAPDGALGFILRRPPGGAEMLPSAQAIGLATEAAVIKSAIVAGAPAPRVAHVLAPEDGLGVGYVMERLAGETIARKILRDADFAQARPKLAADCGACLARIHAAPLDGLPPLPLLDAAAQLDRYEEIYRSFNSPRPIFDLAFAMLRRNVPQRAAPRLVHGDFRLGNIMVDGAGLVAALDWELAHLGDPSEDLGWVCTPSWRFSQVDKPVGGFGEVADFLAAYHAAGGDPDVTADTVRFWTMFGALKWGIMCLTMFRAYDSGLDKTVERAAIGRRSSETELDLILMMRGKL
ncbi:MAG: phosphotransferase family protein [Alphaproteobacteria bacterium]|nr:phosphotransferase family protein [Alphaproteobacteria bacterium]